MWLHTHTHTHRTTVNNLHCCGKMKYTNCRSGVDDRRVLNLFLVLFMVWLACPPDAMGSAVVSWVWAMHEALGDECGPWGETWELPPRLGVDVGPGWGQGPLVAQARPRMLATSRSLCHPGVMQRALRRILALSPVASQVSTAPDACRPASRAAILLSPRLACVTQASPISRRVVLGVLLGGDAQGLGRRNLSAARPWFRTCRPHLESP